MFGILTRVKKITSKFKKQIPCVIQIENGEALKNRVALITGSSSGIGLSIARSFLDNGATVILTGRNQSKLSNAYEELMGRYDNRVFMETFDMNDCGDFINIFERIEGKYHISIDILVNNAGIACKGIFPDITEEEYDSVMNTNLKGPFLLSQEFARMLISKRRKGNILFVGSSSSFRPGNNPYILSKWGIRSLTMGLGKSLIKHGIVVNGIAPGPTLTSLYRPDDNDLTNRKMPSGRISTSEEIASLATQLVSDSCRMIVGEMVAITGGSGTLTFDDVDY